MDKKKIKKSPQWAESILNRRFTKLLDEKIKSDKIKIEDFAKHFNISTEAVRLWTTGYTRPDLDKIIKIANYFCVSCDYLLGNTDIPRVDTTYQEINKLTGLNQKSIDALKNMKKINNSFSPNYDKNYADVINDLISSYGFIDLIKQIGECFVLYNDLQTLTINMKEKDISDHESKTIGEQANKLKMYYTMKNFNPHELGEDFYDSEFYEHIDENKYMLTKKMIEITLWSIEKTFINIVEKQYKI